MNTRHDVTVGHELRTATETGQIPAVPTADAGERQNSWRSSLGVTLALVVTFALVTIVSL